MKKVPRNDACMAKVSPVVDTLGESLTDFEWPQAGGCQSRATATRVSQSSLPRGGINFAFKKLCYKQVGSLVLCNIVCRLPVNVCRKLQVNVFLRCDKVCMWYDAASVCPPQFTEILVRGQMFLCKLVWFNSCLFGTSGTKEDVFTKRKFL